ncbi:succinate dehydrogenase [candidate division KSB1 bacterium]|nr:MAG: succinate dehydrogenase [candidate division KSB1 bacterium]
MKFKLDYEKCDVLIAGGGGAGLRAALEASSTGRKLKVCLITRGKIGESGVTANAYSDRMAFHVTLPSTPPFTKDNWKYHARDIYRTGGAVSDYNLAEILAKDSAEAFYFLDEIGVPFVKDESGNPVQFKTDGSEYPRACYTGPDTAKQIENALINLVKESSISVIENLMLAELLVKNGKVCGALCIKEEEEIKFLYIQAKSVVLATGGAGGIFRINLFPEGMTGDGYASAFRKGAELVNMEFIQIGIASMKTKLACSGSLMRAVPRIINEKGEEILYRYFRMSPVDLAELLFNKGDNWPIRDDVESTLIDIAIFREIVKGSRIYLDFSKNPEGFLFESFSDEIKKRYWSEVENVINESERNISPFCRLKEINSKVVFWLKKRGIDLEKGDLIEIAPSVQHFQGGVKINEKAETTIANLFAVGETAGGQHGANRPGGNALLDCQVFGKIAGYEAALRAYKDEFVDVDIKPIIFNLLAYFKKTGISAEKIREKILNIMYGCGTVIRSEDSIRKGLKEIELLENMGLRIEEYPLYKAMETKNIIDTGKIILNSALLRKESRGPHLFFSSYSDKKYVKRKGKVWEKYIVVRREKDRVVCKLQNTVKMPANIELF